MNHEIIEQFKTAMFEHGIQPPEHIIADGKLHRFKIGGKLNGAYVLHMDGRAAGYFQDFKQGIKTNWKADGYINRLTDADRRAFAELCRADEAKRQAEEATKHKQAANQARYIWMRSTPAAEHPYLARKRIKAHGTRVSRSGDLVVPVYDAALELVSLEFIKPEKVDGRDKLLLPGGKITGCFWWIGKQSNRILIAEGFSTAASIHEHTGEQVFIAFNAGNLASVAKVIRSVKPDAEIIIMADNDISGVGQTKARAAALAIGAKYLVCPEPGKDFNDYLTRELKRWTSKHK